MTTVDGGGAAAGGDGTVGDGAGGGDGARGGDGGGGDDGHTDGHPDGHPDGRSRQGTVVRWVVGLVVVAGLLTFLLVGANRPADPHLLPSLSRPQVPGFDEIAYRIDKTTANQRCALLAATTAQQQQGLMNRTDLAGHDGMLFRFNADTRVGFYMQDTPIPLSIAWFDSHGNFVSSTDMEPCLDKVDCPNYYAAGPYRFALEVGKGDLGDLGVGPGSHLTVGGACS